MYREFVEGRTMSMSNLKLSSLLRVVIATLVLSGLAASAMAYLSNSKVQSANQLWTEYSAENNYEASLTRTIVASLGYGGFIHDFKNFLLRGDDARLARITQARGSIVSALAELENLTEDADSLAAIADIRGVVDAYHEAALQARQYNAIGQKAAHIDASMQINDDPALAGLDHLRSNVGSGGDTKLEVLNKGTECSRCCERSACSRIALVSNFIHKK